MYIYIHIHMYIHTRTHTSKKCLHTLAPTCEREHHCLCCSGVPLYVAIHCSAMQWLRLVGSLKLQVSFAKERYKRDDILQKRPIIFAIQYSVARCFAVCCSVLQCIVMCCGVFWCVLVCRSVLQCVEVCCSVLQGYQSMMEKGRGRNTTHCNILQHTGKPLLQRCSALQCVAVRCSAWQCVAVRSSALQCVAVRCSALPCVAVRCSVSQCAAVRCSALQCAAVRCSALQCVERIPKYGGEGGQRNASRFAVCPCGLADLIIRHGPSPCQALPPASCEWPHDRCCSVLQCVAVCCSVLQCVEVC